MLCVCRARAVYRIFRGSQERYRCAACASAYPYPEWNADLLPGFRRDEAEDAYQHYRELRTRVPYLTPEQIGTLPRFGAFEAFEARFQRERRKGVAA